MVPLARHHNVANTAPIKGAASASRAVPCRRIAHGCCFLEMTIGPDVARPNATTVNFSRSQG